MAKLARNLFIKWKRVAIEYEAPVNNLNVQFRHQLNNNLLALYRSAEWKLKRHPTVRFTQQ